ncbi:MAG TPA: S1 RNA-binding domain-containing protein, partial [Oligoflexia bacterium]|nr:S1 RNA-binding domain-containing protein [Oligoflexia bacterium]
MKNTTTNIMNQQEIITNSSSTVDLEFEQLLKDSFDAARPGQLVTGTILEIGRDYVIVDIGFKSEGHVPVSQFTDREGKLKVKVGDRVEVLMLSSENESGEIVLSRDRAEQLRVWNDLEVAFGEERPVSGVVVQKVKGGLQVDVGVPAFLPGSQVDIRPQRNLDKFVGESMEFKILKFSRERGNIVLSRRVVLEAERKALKRDTI